jgi:competence protein ComEC
MAAVIIASAPSQGGAIAAAIIVGDHSAMTEDTVAVLQDAGLAHIVSSSGLHMAVMSGFIFCLLKCGLALVPWIALRIPVSRIAAGAALDALALFLLISGGSLSPRSGPRSLPRWLSARFWRTAPQQHAWTWACGVFHRAGGARGPRGAGLSDVVRRDDGPGRRAEALAQPDGPKGRRGPLIGELQAFGWAMTGAVAASAVAGAATELFALQHF